jgi:hypothetical protein
VLSAGRRKVTGQARISGFLRVAVRIRIETRYPGW